MHLQRGCGAGRVRARERAVEACVCARAVDVWRVAPAGFARAAAESGPSMEAGGKASDGGPAQPAHHEPLAAAAGFAAVAARERAAVRRRRRSGMGCRGAAVHAARAPGSVLRVCSGD